MLKKRFLSILLACLLLSLSACGQSEQDKKFDELTKSSSAPASSQVDSAPVSSSEAEPTPEPTPYVDPEGLEGEFTILAFARMIGGGQQEKMEALAGEFMKLHPGVTINVEYSYKASEMLSQQERRNRYQARLLAELGSGEADYLLFSPVEEVNIYRLSKSGLFIDLWPYFNSDPTINPDDYYSQILEAVQVDGKLTTMPFSFGFDGMLLNRPLMEKIGVDLDNLQSFDYQQLLDWREQARAVDPDVQVTFGAVTQKVLYNVEAPVYIDLENGTSDYDSPGFVEFLARTGSLEESDKEGLDDNLSGTDVHAVEWMMKQRDSGEEPDMEFIPQFMQNLFYNAHEGVALASDIMSEELGYLGHQLEYLAGPYPITSTKGQLSISTAEDFAIPASMKNPDLAWKFISYCISDRQSMTAGGDTVNIEGIDYFTGDLYTSYIPINKKNFVHQMDFLCHNGMAYTGSYYSGYEQKYIDPDICAQKLDEFLAMPLVNSKTHVIPMNDYLTEFYDNKLTTPEQCAEKIQGRAFIWLNE